MCLTNPPGPAWLLLGKKDGRMRSQMFGRGQMVGCLPRWPSEELG